MESEIKIVKSLVDIQKEEQFKELLAKLKIDVTFRVLKLEFNNLNHKELTKAEELVRSVVNETHDYATVVDTLARCMIATVDTLKEKNNGR